MICLLVHQVLVLIKKALPLAKRLVESVLHLRVNLRNKIFTRQNYVVPTRKPVPVGTEGNANLPMGNTSFALFFAIPSTRRRSARHSFPLELAHMESAVALSTLRCRWQWMFLRRPYP